jgi:lipoprotein-anchoring transpeptidase ErfK/SrfK
MTPALRRAATAAVLVIAIPDASRAETVTVFAAASLASALAEIETAFEAETGHDLVVSLAGSSALARQIQQGAPADVFISASVEWMDVIEAEGLVDEGSRVDLLGNTIVLVAFGEAEALSTPDAGQQATRRNISGFSNQDWRAHFDTLGAGAIVCDTASRAVHFWSGDGETYRVYPSSVPMTEDLTKRGYTTVQRKKVGPSWTPTLSQRQRFPDWKPIPPGPENPLGTHAMYLGWPAYIIHGTHDTRKIGRRSSDGCFGLFNEQIAELFELTPVGAQVRVI